MQSTIGICERLLLHGRLKGLNYQSVRFYPRKPRWVPTAKSKLYKIYEVPYAPHHETEEFLKLEGEHRTYTRALWDFQRGIYNEQVAISQSDADHISEEGDMERILLVNERDNAIVKEIREKQRVEEWKFIEEDIRQRKSRRQEKELKAMEETEQILQAQMDKLGKIITEKDLDEAIEKALATVVDYNYAIDKNNQIYKGRYNSDKAEEIPEEGITKVEPVVGSQSI